jgi:hypothetical protein
MDRNLLEFEASSGARLGALALLVFWLLFAAFWAVESWNGPRGTAVYVWCGIALTGLVLQIGRVRAVRRPLLALERQELIQPGLLFGTLRQDLGRVQSASVQRRRSRATLCLRFDAKGLFRGRWLYPVDELEEPRSFVSQLLPRIPQAFVDESVRRYLVETEAQPQTL